jgi:hypothetical protein
MSSLRPLLLCALLLPACASQNRSYVSKHPELSAAHRQIIVSGKIPSGTAVAGMTHEQVKVAMGGFPLTFDKINGQEVWVYERKKLVATEFSEGFHNSRPRDSRTDSTALSDNVGGQADAVEKTSVFFTGDRATHAQFSEQPR